MSPIRSRTVFSVGFGGRKKPIVSASRLPAGASFISATSLLFNGTTYNVGDSLQSGYFGGFISSQGDGIADIAIIISPKSTGENSSKAWQTGGTNPGTYTEWDGLTNSNNVNDANHPAVNFCRSLTIGGYTDWYLPSLAEMNAIYRNLKPTTDLNETNTFYGARRIGSAPFGVTGQTSDWTAGGPPVQTSVNDFKSGGTQAFVGTNYWTSTKSPSVPWVTSMLNGGQFNNPGWDPIPASTALYVRAVRKLTAS